MAAHGLGADPAALAFAAWRRLHGNGQAGDLLGRSRPGPGRLHQLEVRDNGRRLQANPVFPQKARQFPGGAKQYPGLQGVADNLILTGQFQDLGHLAPHGQHALPPGVQRLVKPGVRIWRQLGQKDGAHPLARGGQVLPGLGRGKGKHWSHKQQQPLGNNMQHGLGRLPRPRLGGQGVEPILNDIEIQGAHGQGAETVETMEHGVELEIPVSLAHLALQEFELVQGPAVQLLQVIVGHAFLVRVEITEVTQEKTDGVTDLTVGVGELAQDVVGNLDVVAIVLRGHPKAQDLGPVLFDDLLGRDDVADALGHLLALAVHDETVGQDALEGRRPPGAHRGEQAGLKPAAMLVAALQIEISRRGQFLALLEHRGEAHPGVEPDVQDVALLVELAAAAGATAVTVA